MAQRATTKAKPADPPGVRALQVEMMEIGKIRPYPGNPRKANDAVAKVRASLEKYGFQQPIVVDRDMVIIAGHTRHQAALAMGMPLVPVTIATNLTEAQAKAYRIEDNRSGAEAEFDLSLLQIEMADLAVDGIDLASLGFNVGELDKLAEPVDQGSDGDDEDEPGTGRRRQGNNGLGNKVISYSLIFETEAQQAVWFDFLRELKRTMPELETIGARLTRFLNEQALV